MSEVLAAGIRGLEANRRLPAGHFFLGEITMVI
jgi:hypothetical protein